MTDVTVVIGVVIGAGGIGQAIARRISSGRHVLVANQAQDAAAEALSLAGFEVRVSGRPGRSFAARAARGSCRARGRGVQYRFGSPALWFSGWLGVAGAFRADGRSSGIRGERVEARLESV